MVAFIEKVHFNKADFVRPPLEQYDKVSGRSNPVNELPTEQDDCRLKMPAEGPHSLHVGLRRDAVNGSFHVLLALYSPAYEPVARTEIPFAVIVSAYDAKVRAGGEEGVADIAGMEAARQEIEPALRAALSGWIRGKGDSLLTPLSRGLVRSVLDLRVALTESKRFDLKKIAAQTDPYGGKHRGYDDHRRAN